jgi:uncharacterized protein YkwD
MGPNQEPSARSRPGSARSRGLNTKVLAGAVVAGIASLVVLLSAQRAPAHTWYAGVRTACAGSTAKMRCYHGLTRQRAGLHGLRWHRRLRRAAQLKSDRIIMCRQLSHRPCGDAFVRPFYRAGYLPWPRSWLVGENLAWSWRSAWGAFHALMHSSSHRANILNPAFRDIGIWQGPSPWGILWIVHYGRRS